MSQEKPIKKLGESIAFLTRKLKGSNQHSWLEGIHAGKAEGKGGRHDTRGWLKVTFPRTRAGTQERNGHDLIGHSRFQLPLRLKRMFLVLSAANNESFLQIK